MGAVAAMSVAVLIAPAGASASHGVTAPVSVSSAGVIGDDQSNYADLTPDAPGSATSTRTSAPGR